MENQTGKTSASPLIDFDMWLACHTQEEIAKTVCVDQATVARAAETMHSVLQNQTHKPAASHLIDFDMWLACHTQEENADAVGLPHQGVAKVSDDFLHSVLENQTKKSAASHLIDFDMWLACHTQEEIAEASDCPLGTVKGLLAGDNSLVGMVLKNQTNQRAASHLIDFDPPIYNVWKQQARTPGSSHFGNSESRWVVPPVPCYPDCYPEPPLPSVVFR